MDIGPYREGPQLEDALGPCVHSQAKKQNSHKIHEQPSSCLQKKHKDNCLDWTSTACQAWRYLNINILKTEGLIAANFSNILSGLS